MSQPFSPLTLDEGSHLTVEMHSIAASSMKGCSRLQQDAYYSAPKDSSQQNLIAAIFDGHGELGDFISAKAQAEAPDIFNQITLNGEADKIDSLIVEAFAKINDKIKTLSYKKHTNSGSTGIMLLQNATEYIIAHCGDSRAVWQQNGTIYQTEDHTCSNPKEIQRVGKGKIIDNRLGGKSICTRAFGDTTLQFVGLIPTPAITKIAKSDVSYILLGSDGLFDYASTKKDAQSPQTDDNSLLWSIIEDGDKKNESVEHITLKLAAIAICNDRKTKAKLEEIEQFLNQKNITETKVNGKDERERLTNLTNLIQNADASRLKEMISNFNHLLHDNTTIVLVKNPLLEEERNNLNERLKLEQQQQEEELRKQEEQKRIQEQEEERKKLEQLKIQEEQEQKRIQQAQKEREQKEMVLINEFQTQAIDLETEADALSLFAFWHIREISARLRLFEATVQESDINDQNKKTFKNQINYIDTILHKKILLTKTRAAQLTFVLAALLGCIYMIKK